MGRVKDFYHDEICAGACDQGDPGPRETEVLAYDIARSIDRYIEAAQKDPAGGAAEWGALALASDKLSHFLDQTKPIREAAE